MDWSMRLALAALLIGACLPAREGARAQIQIREQDVLDAVGSGHPALRALQGLTAEARGELAAARRWDNPAVWVEREAYDDDLTETRVGVSLSLPFDGRRSLRGRAADYGLTAAEAEATAAALTLRAQIRADYAGWYVLSQRLHAYRKVRELATELSRMMEDRAQAGEASRLELRRLQLAAAELEALEAAADAESESARRLMIRWHPGTAENSEPIAPALPPAPDVIDVHGRPDVVASLNRRWQYDTQRRLSGRWFRLPDVDVGWIDQSQSSGGTLVGLSWKIPLFERGQGDGAAARSRAAAAAAAYDDDTLRARLEWTAARDSYERLRATALAQAEYAALSDSIIMAATAAFRAGELGITDFLESLRSVQASRVAALDLYASALAAHRRLELAAGQPLLIQRGDR